MAAPTSPIRSIIAFAGLRPTESSARRRGPAAIAQLNRPISVAIDALHNLYIADSSNNEVRKITRDGVILPVATELNSPQYVAVDAAASV
jgi:hypothetical protein